MGTRPSLNPFTLGSGLVDERLGTAYQVVAAVYEQLEAITGVHEELAHILSVDASLNIVAAVGEHLAAVAPHIDDVVTVAANLVTMETILTNITEIRGAMNAVAAVEAAALAATTKAGEASDDAIATSADRAAVVQMKTDVTTLKTTAVDAAGRAEAAATEAADIVSSGGVASFKGRTGQIVPMAGDYTATLITESETRKFATPGEKLKLAYMTVTDLVNIDDLVAQAGAAAVKTDVDQALETKADAAALATSLNDIVLTIDAKAVQNSPELLGTPLTPTADLGNDTNQIANTAFVARAVAALGEAAAPLSDTMVLQGNLAEATDLDTLAVTGWFRQPSDAAATLALNYPVVLAGTLEVFAGGAGTMQRYTTNIVGTPRMFVRTSNTGAWSLWQELRLGTETISAAAPDGGVDGDFWYQV